MWRLLEISVIFFLSVQYAQGQLEAHADQRTSYCRGTIEILGGNPTTYGTIGPYSYTLTSSPPSSSSSQNPGSNIYSNTWNYTIPTSS